MHSTMKYFSLFLLAFLAALPAGAQTDTNAVAAPAMTDMPHPPADASTNTRAMSLEDCIQEALQHNLDVQIQRYNPQIALYTLRSAYAGYDPSLNISGQHAYSVSPGGYNPYSTNPIPARVADANSFGSSIGGTLPWGLEYTLSGTISEQYGSSGLPFDNSQGNIGVTLRQPLLKNFWIDSTRLTIRVNKNHLKFTEQGLRAQVIASVTAVENAYYELIFAQENVKVQQDALELAQTQLDQDNQRVQIGTLAILDVQQDEAQVAQSKASLISAFSTLGTDQRVLKNLLTDEYSKWFGQDIQPVETLTAPEQTFNLQGSWRKGMTERPDLLQARLNVEQQGIQLKYARNQLFPELDLTGTYGFNGASREFSGTFSQFNEGNAPFYSYGAQITVPLSNIGARNQYKASKAALQQVLLQLKQLEQLVMVEIDNAVGVAESDYQSVQASRQARIYAEAALDAEQKKYAVGKSTTFTVLQLQNKLTAARSQEIRDLANYNQALASLAQQEGSTLERDRIDIQTQ